MPDAASPVGAKVNDAVRRAVEIRRRRKAIEMEDAALAHELAGLVRHSIPDLLAEAGTTVWDTDGVPVKLVTKVSGTLKNAPDEAAAVDYLRQNGFAGAMRTVLSVEFSETERVMCAALAESITAATGKDADYTRIVHPATLAAWGRERLGGGIPVDLPKVGLSSWREAHLTITFEEKEKA